jgi:hypothetical protein
MGLAKQLSFAPTHSLMLSSIPSSLNGFRFDECYENALEVVSREESGSFAIPSEPGFPEGVEEP